MRRVFGVPERLAVVGVDLDGGLSERRHRTFCALALVLRIAAVAHRTLAVDRLRAGIRERDERKAPESEIRSLFAFAVNNAAPDPALRTGRIDDEIQPVAVGVAARGAFRADAHGGESLMRMLPVWLVSRPHSVPHFRRDVMVFQRDFWSLNGLLPGMGLCLFME